ncbi:MAG: VCBS domain-containing protein [Synergistaceae bacterium]
MSGNLDATETDKANGITWNFNSGSHYFDGMAAGETLILTYTVQVADPHGGVDTHDVVITITGTNDAPTIIAGGVLTGSATELVDKHADENTLDHTTSGYFDVTDADLTDAVSVSATPQGVGYLGTFTPFVDTQTTGGATGKITWEFKVNDSALDHLAKGETVTQLYDVTVDDGKGGTDTVTVTVTITGTNDAPEIHVRAGDSDAESLTESNIALTATGKLSLSDVDIIDVVNATKVDSIAKGGTYTGTLPTDTDLKAMFSVTGGLTNTESDKDNGITWTFNSGSHLFSELAAGETLILTYTVQVTDPHGGIDTKDVVITITGTNDAPIAVADVDNVKEDVTVQATGNVLTNDTDIDAGDTKEVIGVTAGDTGTEVSVGVGSNITGTYGTLVVNADGTYTYDLDNSAVNVQELLEGQKVYDVFTYTMQDSEGAKSTTTITITVEGTNDHPVAVADINEVKEDVTVQATGDVLLNDTDVDAGDTKEVIGVKAGYDGSDVSGNVATSVDGTYGSRRH